MSLVQKSTSTSVILTPRDYPDPPQFPSSDLSRPSLAAYSQAMSSWWKTTKDRILSLEADVASINTLLSKK